jgi:bifunctional UDP-N-acetylglucosamine pyrophosphorylase/glucosamine-1-phosphate N-acetyltransferase
MTGEPRQLRASIILAAGKGERMKSPRPKVLHPIAGRAIIDHAIDTAQALGCDPIVVVAAGVACFRATERTFADLL